MFNIPINDSPWGEHHKIWNLEDVIALVEKFKCDHKIYHRKRIIIPKGYRGLKKPSVLLHFNDGRQKEEAIVYLEFEK